MSIIDRAFKELKQLLSEIPPNTLIGNQAMEAKHFKQLDSAQVECKAKVGVHTHTWDITKVTCIECMRIMVHKMRITGRSNCLVQELEVAVIRLAELKEDAKQVIYEVPKAEYDRYMKWEAQQIIDTDRARMKKLRGPLGTERP